MVFPFLTQDKLASRFKFLNVLRCSGDESEQEESQEGENKNKAKAKRRKVRVSTIEKNPENLLVDTFDFEFALDPLFRKMSSAFDEAGAHGLLLNRLSVHNNCEVIFDSSTIISGVDAEKEDNDDDEEMEKEVKYHDLSTESLKALLDINIKDLEICSALSSFRFATSEDESDEGKHTALYAKAFDQPVPLSTSHTLYHIASHHIASHRIASHRIASHRIASHHIHTCTILHQSLPLELTDLCIQKMETLRLRKWLDRLNFRAEALGAWAS